MVYSLYPSLSDLSKILSFIFHMYLTSLIALKQEIKELNTAIARCQEQLPASGAPITRQVCPLLILW